MKMIEEMILRSVYGLAELAGSEIAQVERDLDVFVHQVRLERGKEPSGEERGAVRRKLAKKLDERRYSDLKI